MIRKTCKHLSLLSLSVLSSVGGMPAWAAPEPAISPRSWELDFEFFDPQRIQVQIPGAQVPKTFWYVIYTVTNNTGRDIYVLPTFEIVTGKYKVYRSDLAAPPAVYEAIKRRHAKTHPFLVEPIDSLGRLLQGEDNARSSVAIWSAFDAKEDLNTFALFVGGLSGEIVKVGNPGFDPAAPKSEKNPRFFILRKTLMVEYTLPGNLDTQQRADPVRGERSWVMR